ncbi:MAG: hypothetical protein Q9207_008450 [Kuettlingeria erythrocarpa]
MGNHHMLVVGGTQPAEGDPPHQAGVLGCDTIPKFRQGLGIFSLNTHTWTTNYDPKAGAARYQIHNSISKVIGGNSTGGATSRRPKDGFSSAALSSLLGINDEIRNRTPAAAPPSPADSKPLRSFSEAGIAGIVVGSVGSLLLIVGIIWLIRHRGHQNHREPSQKDTSPHGVTSTPVPGSPREIGADPVVPELRGGVTEESLARMYQSNEMPTTSEVHEIYQMPEAFEMPTTFGLHDINYHEMPAMMERPSFNQASAGISHPALEEEK